MSDYRVGWSDVKGQIKSYEGLVRTPEGMKAYAHEHYDEVVGTLAQEVVGFYGWLERPEFKNGELEPNDRERRRLVEIVENMGEIVNYARSLTLSQRKSWEKQQLGLFKEAAERNVTVEQLGQMKAEEPELYKKKALKAFEEDVWTQLWGTRPPADGSGPKKAVIPEVPQTIADDLEYALVYCSIPLAGRYNNAAVGGQDFSQVYDSHIQEILAAVRAKHPGGLQDFCERLAAGDRGLRVACLKDIQTVVGLYEEGQQRSASVMRYPYEEWGRKLQERLPPARTVDEFLKLSQRV
jgi:hypothetical protein